MGDLRDEAKLLGGPSCGRTRHGWAAAAAASPACPPSNRLPQPQPLSADHPDAQAEDLEVLRSFPPSSLQQLAAQRDVLKGYAAESPTAVAAGYCAAYLLMQVGGCWQGAEFPG